MEIMEGYATVPVMHYAMGELAAVPVAGHLIISVLTHVSSSFCIQIGKDCTPFLSFVLIAFLNTVFIYR